MKQDIPNSVQAEKEPEKELKKFQVLYDLAIAMTAGHSLNENLQIIVDNARELLGADAAYIALRDELRNDIFMHTFSGIRTEAFQQMRLPIGKGVGGLVAETRRGLIIEDYFADKKLDRIVDPIVAEEGLISRMAVPMQIGNRNFGVLYVGNRNLTRFSNSDIDTLALIGNLAAVEISRKRTEQSLKEARMELEKRVLERTVELVREIEERKHAESALRESEQRYRVLFRESPIALWEADFSQVKIIIDQLRDQGVCDFLRYFDENPDPMRVCVEKMRLVSVNKAALDLYEVESQKALTDNIDKIFAGKFAVMFQEAVICLAEGKMVEIECQQQTLRGKPITVAAKYSVPPRHEDTWNKVFLSIHDITDRIRAENEQKRLEFRLQQAQKMEAIGTLAGGIAHDFNNILSGIVGYTEIAGLQIVEADRAHAMQSLTKVLKACERAKEMVGQILSFSRHQDHELRPMMVAPIIKEILKLLRASLPSSIEIRQNIDKDVGYIDADPTQIHQVLMNLCSNSAHAMRETGGILEISLEKVFWNEQDSTRYPDAAPGPYVRLSVKDTGHGIPKEMQNRIFEPYFTTKSKEEGTGLGLAVVHGIIKNYKHSVIAVDSEPGKGSTFSLYFPKIEREEPAFSLKKEEIPALGKGRILFVDDERSLVEIGQLMLKQLGYEPTGCANSLEAIELFKEDPNAFDLIITDMTMPKMPGDKLAVEALKIRPDLPIIMCSGFSETINPEKAKALGVRDFIMKPFRMAEMASAIHKALKVS